MLLVPIAGKAVAPPPTYNFRSTSTITETDGSSYTQAMQMASQTNTPVYRGKTVFTVNFSDATLHTVGATGGGGGGAYGGSTGSGGRGATPSYSFKTTSAYVPTVSTSVRPIDESNTLPSRNKIRRSPWDDPEDDPIGVLPNETPVGSPLVLLLFAMVYLVYRRLTKKSQPCG